MTTITDPGEAITDKHRKRINDLIQARRGTLVLGIVALMLPLISPLLLLVCLLYTIEANLLLRRYPNLGKNWGDKLRSTRRAFLIIGALHAAYLAAIVAVVAIIYFTGSG